MRFPRLFCIMIIGAMLLVMSASGQIYLSAASTPTALLTIPAQPPPRVFKAHERYGYGDIRTAHWSPDGSLFAVGGSLGALIYKEAYAEPRGPLTQRAFIETHTPITQLAWSPDGSKIMLGSSRGDLFLWDLKTHRLKSVYSEPNGVQHRVTSIAWRDNRTVAVAFDSARPLPDEDHTPASISVWDAITGKPTMTLETKDRRFDKLAWNPDGTKIGASGYLRGKRHEDGRGIIYYAMYAADSGKTLASLSDDALAAQDSERYRMSFDHELTGWSVDGKSLVIRGDLIDLDGQLRPDEFTWNGISNTLTWNPTLSPAKTAYHYAQSMGYGADYKQLAAWEYDDVLLVQNGQQRLRISTSAIIYSLEWNVRGELLIFVDDIIYILNDATAFALDREAPSRLLTLTDFAMYDDVYPYWSADGTLQYDKYEDQALATYNLRDKYVIDRRYLRERYVVFSHDNTKYVTDDGVIYSAATGSKLIGLDLPSLGGGSDEDMNYEMSTSPVWNANDQLIARESAEGLVVWSVESGSFIFSVWAYQEVDPSSHFIDFAWHPDGNKIAGIIYSHAVYDTDVYQLFVWDVRTEQRIAQCTLSRQGGERTLMDDAWSPKGNYIVTLGGEVCDVQTGKVTALFDTPTAIARWNSTGSRLLLGNQTQVILFDGKTLAQVATLNGHNAEAAEFSHNAKLLATGNDNGLIAIWDAETGQALYIFEGHTDKIRSLAWSPDDQQLLSTSADNTIRVWVVPEP